MVERKGVSILDRDNVEVIEAKRGLTVDVTVTMPRNSGDLVEVVHAEMTKIIIDHLTGSVRLLGFGPDREERVVLYSDYASIRIIGPIMKRRKRNQPVVSKSPGDTGTTNAKQ